MIVVIPDRMIAAPQKFVDGVHARPHMHTEKSIQQVAA
jgi:hypothetical protein